MQITEVRVRLVNNKDDRLKAFCSMTMDDEFVVRDIKVIDGTGGYFVAMPSRKMSSRCPKCDAKNHLGAKFCSSCGHRLPQGRVRKDLRGKVKLHADVAHPISAECRRRIQEALIGAYEKELERSKQPDYKPFLEDELDDDALDMTR